MYVNQTQDQTSHLPTRLKLILAVPVAILVCQLMLLILAGVSDPMQIAL